MKDTGKTRITSLLLALLMLVSVLPQTAVPVFAQEEGAESEAMTGDPAVSQVLLQSESEEQKPLAGKTIACVGDSITAAYGVTRDETDYVTLLAQRLGMNYIRLGDSGTTLCTDGSRVCNIRRLTEDQLQGADVVTIAMGINDFCNAAGDYYKLGDINATDTSTIYGAARMWCQRIAELRKTDSLSNTQFYFVTPVITSWNNSVTSARDWDQSKKNVHGYTLRDLCNAIIEVAELYEVPVIDLNLLSGMYYVDAEDQNTAVFGGDGVHPGVKGHEMMAHALANVLLQNHLRNDHEHTFGSWITTTWPSCTPGEQQRVCSICSAAESRMAEPSGAHAYEAAVTLPTCTEQGYTTYTCTTCGDSYVGDEVDALGHSYENGICTGCGSNVLELSYTHATPESQGVANAIARAYLLTDVTWTPVANIPGVDLVDEEWVYKAFEAGKTYQGIPYSGVIGTDTYVGLNVSLDSFLSAVVDKNSLLYTQNLFSDGYPKAATYYGTVCSKFAQYVLDIPGSYNTYNIPNIPGMDTIAMPGQYTVDQVKLGDIVVDTSYHTAVCTDILYHSDGSVAYIEISEAMPPTVRRLLWSADEFYAAFATYRLCRYQYMDDVPVAPDWNGAERDYALMPRQGDKYNYPVSTQRAVADILKTGYSKAVVLLDGVIVDEIPVDDSTETIRFDRSIPGKIEIYLEKADGTRSSSVYAYVVESSVTVTDSSHFTSGKLSVSFSGSSGTPLYVQVGSGHAIFCNVEDKTGMAELVFPFAMVSGKTVRVAYQNEYGIYLSPWSYFTTVPNTSTDPYLSQAEYWDGFTLTPGSSAPVVQDGKTGYWTYAMIPVEENTTYFSEGSNRMWFFDKDGNAISTHNAYTQSEVPFQFTTPLGTAYVSISYAPELVEKGTETLTKCHAYTPVITPPTCTEQGYTTYTCTVCGDSYVGDEADALGHDFTDYRTNGDGTLTGHCSRCGEPDTLPDPAIRCRINSIAVADAAGAPQSGIPAGVCQVTVSVTKVAMEGDFVLWLAAYTVQEQFVCMVPLAVEDLASGETKTLTVQLDNTAGLMERLKAFCVESWEHPAPQGLEKAFLPQ